MTAAHLILSWSHCLHFFQNLMFSWFLKTWEQEVLLHVYPLFLLLQHNTCWGEWTSARRRRSEQRPPPLSLHCWLKSALIYSDGGHGEGPGERRARSTRAAHSSCKVRSHSHSVPSRPFRLCACVHAIPAPSHSLSWSKRRHENPDSQLLFPALVIYNHRWQASLIIGSWPHNKYLEMTELMLMK